MPGSGQFVKPVQVEVSTDIGADVGLDGAAPPGTELRGLAIMGYFEAGNELFVPRTNASGELIVQVSGGGGGVGITDTDDNSIAAGQTTLLSIDENYIFNGTTWIRHQGGVDNAVAPASPQGAFVGGVVTSPVGTFADGDVCLLHFDTSGRLLVSGATGVGITDTDDNSVASGQTTLLSIDENYVFDGTNWIRLQGGVDNAFAPMSPQGAFIAGIARSPLVAYTSGDVVIPTFDLFGRLNTASIGSPGASLTSPADVSVAAGATVALAAPPAGTRRQVVQVTGGDSTTIVRVREAGGLAGSGRVLQLYGSTLYGGLDGSVVPLEVENVAGPAATVHIDFEG